MTKDGVSSDSDNAAAKMPNNLQDISDQFIPNRNRKRGVSEADSLKDDVRKNTGDAGRIAIDVIALATTVASAGTAAPAVAGAKVATGETAKGITTGVIKDTTAKATAKVGEETLKKAGAELGSEATKRVAKQPAESIEKKIADNLDKTVKGAKKSISDLTGNSIKNEHHEINGKSRIQEAIDNLNDNRSDTHKSFKHNRELAKEKQSQPNELDHRGKAERQLDSTQKITGVDGLKTVGKIPMLGGIVESGINIKMRTDRQVVKMRKKTINVSTGAIVGALILFATLLVNLAGAASGGAAGAASVQLDDAGTCVMGSIGAEVNVSTVPAGPIAGYSDDQLINAAHIMNAAQKMNISSFGQTIGVMTAMGESSLVNIAYGDNATNPDGSIADSIGLFQQQGSWGSIEQRMNPEQSATFFFQRMIGVAGWENMIPTIIANRVQINADENHYTRWYPQASSVVAALSGIRSDAGGGTNCAETTDGSWVFPVSTNLWYISDIFGGRDVICSGTFCSGNFHYGVDMAPGCGPGPHKVGCIWQDPIVVGAASAGIVIEAKPNGRGSYGNYVKIQHEGKDSQIATLYAHMLSVSVNIGDKVEAGAPIGIMGSTGVATGRHLHFETWVNGLRKDPMLILKPMGLIFE